MIEFAHATAIAGKDGDIVVTLDPLENEGESSLTAHVGLGSGDVLITTGQQGGKCALFFGSSKEQGAIGERQANPQRVNECPEVRLTFDNVDSLDVILRQLHSLRALFFENPVV